MKRRRNTKFSSWVNSYSVRSVASGLSRSGMPTTVQAIYQWLSGRTLPRLTHAACIIELSNGKLSVSDILTHYTEVKKGMPNE